MAGTFFKELRRQVTQSPFVRGPVGVKNVLWLSKSRCDVFSPGYRVILAGEAVVRTERSEFIFSRQPLLGGPHTLQIGGWGGYHSSLPF
jgi:hypothetical protein